MNKNERDEYMSRMREILDNQELSQVQKKAALTQIMDELIHEDIEPEPEKQSRHWPGMYDPKPIASYNTIEWNGVRGLSQIKKDDYRNLQELKFRRIYGIACKTSDEARAIETYKNAQLAIIDRLKELNGGWRPDWSDNTRPNWVPYFNHNDNRIDIVGNTIFQTMPDWFHAKTKEIWKQIIEEFGDKKVRLALWLKYKGE